MGICITAEASIALNNAIYRHSEGLASNKAVSALLRVPVTPNDADRLIQGYRLISTALLLLLFLPSDNLA